MADDQRIKVTLGITGLSGSRVHIDGLDWHLDVDSSFPGAARCPKGLAVRQVKGYVSWVKSDVSQDGCYLLLGIDSIKKRIFVREDLVLRAYSIPVV